MRLAEPYHIWYWGQIDALAAEHALAAVQAQAQTLHQRFQTLQTQIALSRVGVTLSHGGKGRHRKRRRR